MNNALPSNVKLVLLVFLFYKTRGYRKAAFTMNNVQEV